MINSSEHLELFYDLKGTEVLIMEGLLGLAGFGPDAVGGQLTCGQITRLGSAGPECRPAPTGGCAPHRACASASEPKGPM